MNSKQTGDSQEKKQIPDNWMPESIGGKAKSTKPTKEEVEARFREMFPKNATGGTSLQPDEAEKDEGNNLSDATIQPEDSTSTVDSLQTEPTDTAHSTVATGTKRTSGKQRKESLEEYRQTFLSVPKLEDRKPVFISREVRDRLDEIARKLGGRGRSVSGFIENLARHHLEIYQDDVELWKKL